MGVIERDSVCTFDCPDTCSLSVTVEDGRTGDGFTQRAAAGLQDRLIRAVYIQFLACKFTIQLLSCIFKIQFLDCICKTQVLSCRM